ncbi:MAG: tetratricopeptide repeat protein [Deltaproteobacteria bacterium]|nr:MAG: tetratricopeptide repeat protein [Deltaproteobacteria bacterium]
MARSARRDRSDRRPRATPHRRRLADPRARALCARRPRSGEATARNPARAAGARCCCGIRAQRGQRGPGARARPSRAGAPRGAGALRGARSADAPRPAHRRARARDRADRARHRAAAHRRLARAEADALRALEAAPQLPRAVDLAYSIFAAEQKLDDAQRAFEAAEAAGALHGGARALLARIYLARGEAEKAQAIYQRVLAESPDIALAQLASLRPAGGVTQPRARPRSRRRRTRSAHLAPVRAPA